MNRKYAPLFPTPNADPLVKNIEALSYKERRRFLTQNVNPGYPRFLYRYTSLNPADSDSVDHLRQVLVESLLWLNSPLDFNDPFDMSTHVIFTGNGAEKRAALSKKFKQMSLATSWKIRQQRIDELANNPAKTLKLIREIFRKNLQAVGVCCFTPCPKNLLMWSHYANNHKGVVLQFHPAHDVDMLTRPVPVEYSNSYPIADWINDTHGELRKIMLRKYEQWGYEHEWRITNPEAARTHQPFNPNALTGIIIGCRASTETKAKVRELLVERENRGLPLIKLFQAEMHQSDYKLLVRGA